MITKVKKSISLSNNEHKKRERRQRDIEIINANAKRFKKEAEENLKYQAARYAVMKPIPHSVTKN